MLRIFGLWCLGALLAGPLYAQLDLGVFQTIQPAEAKQLISEYSNWSALTNAYGDTALHIAAAYNDSPKVIRLLIKQAGLDPKTVNDNGWNALHMAAAYGTTPSVVSVLAKTHRIQRMTNDAGMIPLSTAVLLNPHWDVIKAVLSISTKNLEMRDNMGQTALHKSVFQTRFPNLTDVLIKQGSKVDALDSNQQTPLHVAAYRNNLPAIKTLIKYRNFVFVQDNEGNAPLHLSLLNNPQEDVIDFLLLSGAPINLTNSDGLTPLHVAALHGVSLSVMEMLLKAGADAKARTPFGFTARSYVEKRPNNEQVLFLLSQYGG